MNQNYSGTQCDDEVEIDLKDLIFTIIKKWRSIIIVGLIAGCIAGGYKFMKGIFELRDAASREENTADYDLALQEYNTSKEFYEIKIKNLNNELDLYNDYCKKSILMNIDSYNVHKDVAMFYVNTGFEVMPNALNPSIDPTLAVMDAYASVVNRGDIYDDIKKKLGRDVDVRYIKELVRVDENYDSGILTVTTIGDTQELAEEIMKYVSEELYHSTTKISADVHTHTITKFSETSFNTVDKNIRANFGENNLITTNGETGNDYIQDLRTQIASLQDASDQLEKPADNTISQRNVVKHAAKFGLIGLIGGAFVLAFCYAIAYVLNGRITTAGQLESRLHVPVIGAARKLVKRRSLSFVDAFLLKLEDADHEVLVSEAERDEIEEKEIKHLYDLTAANAAALLKETPEIRTLALIGTADSEMADLLHGIESKLPEFTVKAAGNILDQADAVKTLQDADAAVIVEQQGISRYDRIQREITMVNSLGKKLVGVVIL